jgi:methyl-accepting chemotaxis protein
MLVLLMTRAGPITQQWQDAMDEDIALARNLMLVLSAVALLGMVEQIANAGQEQGAGIEQINRAVTEMDTVTQQNAASTAARGQQRWRLKPG